VRPAGGRSIILLLQNHPDDKCQSDDDAHLNLEISGPFPAIHSIADLDQLRFFGSPLLHRDFAKLSLQGFTEFLPAVFVGSGPIELDAENQRRHPDYNPAASTFRR
jgi:hypothetical protein